MVIGSGLIALYAAMVFAAMRAHDRATRNKLLPWIALGGFAAISAAMASLTRIGFGANQALDSRYTTFSLLLSVGLIGGYEPAVSLLRTKLSTRRSQALLRARIETASVTVLFVLWAYSAMWGVAWIRSNERMRLWGKAGLLCANVAHTELVYQTYLGGWAPDILKAARELNQLGLLHPQLFATNEVERLREGRTDNREIGYLDEITTAGAIAEAKGWAVLPDYSRVADAVAVSYRGADNHRRLFALNDQTADRPDAAMVLKRHELVRCGWSTHFDRSTLPPGPQTIEAWAIDARTGILYPLGFEQVVP
jgi:hypothetical protein